MKYDKIYVRCRVCNKELLDTSFSKHLRKHYDPKSSLCHKWYKGYFKNDDGIVVCSICDESIYPDPDSYGYDFEEHLLMKHNISKETQKL